MAVVATVKLDNLVPPCDPAGQSNGRHGRFRARRHKRDAVGVPVVGQNQLPSSFSNRVGVPKDVPLAMVAVTFSTTAGCAWPKINGPHEQQKIDELVAVCVPNVGTLSRSMKRGVPPTDLKARTGEFTPPGKRDCALSNKAAEEDPKECCHLKGN